MSYRTQDSGYVPIEHIAVSAYTVPTDAPEADGTFRWDRTTLVLVEATAGGTTGLGYSYADTATARLVNDTLAGVVQGCDALSIPAAHAAMVGAIRNLGCPGISSMAISAVDTALWDLKGRLLGLSLVSMLGAAHDSATLYGSGGFTSYTIDQLQRQLGAWAEQGIPRVKMKIGTHPDTDVERVKARARPSAGKPSCSSTPTVLTPASRRSSRPRHSLRSAFPGSRNRSRPMTSKGFVSCAIERRRGCRSPRVSTATTCSIFDGCSKPVLWMCCRPTRPVARGSPDSCAPVHCARHSVFPFPPIARTSLHYQACCSLPPFCHLEYFHDHERIEHLFFDGAPVPDRGQLRPDRSRPDLGSI